MIDKIVILNLLRNPHRRIHMQKFMLNSGISENDYEFFDGFDGSDLKISKNFHENFSVYKNWKIGNNPNPELTKKTFKGEFYSRDVTWGEVGCGLSQYHIWKEAYNNSYSGIIHFEDDADATNEDYSWYSKLIKYLPEILTECPDLDLLYLGRMEHASLSVNSEPEKIVLEFPEFSVLRVSYFSWCNFGYYLTSSGLEKLVKSNFPQNLITPDEFFIAASGCATRMDMRLLFGGIDLRAYAIFPDMICHLCRIFGSDTENSGYVLEK